MVCLALKMDRVELEGDMMLFFGVIMAYTSLSAAGLLHGLPQALLVLLPFVLQGGSCFPPNAFIRNCDVYDCYRQLNLA